MKGTAIELRKLNRNRIYKLIHGSAQMAKQDIAIELSLSLPTVNQNLKELVSMGLIDYSGTFDSTGGRKAKAITLVAEAKYAIGLELTQTHIRLVAVDLCGTAYFYEKQHRMFSAHDEYGQYLGDIVHSFIAKNQIPNEKILGVGISIPGTIDDNIDYIGMAPSLKVKRFSRSMLTRYIPYPCIIDNDANAGGFAEMWNSNQENTLAYLSVEAGVGGSILINNTLFKGHHQRAGEFGHMIIQPNGRKCNCGKNGCLEGYVSIARLSDDLGCQLEEFFIELDRGNEIYGKIWDSYLDYLCVGINNIRMALDCDVILGGVIVQYLDPYVEEMQNRLSELNTFEKNGNYFRLGKYHSMATAVGVALQHVDKFIETI
jgi:predicted NBD/HSP70 family sugar kinase